jgi:leucine dehydrogenase
MLTIKELNIPGYKKVIEAQNPDANLHCFIAIHDCTLGPALGGTRIHKYANTQEALNDVLRLSKAMTYKSALVENGLGGGKSVIIADAKKEKTPQLLAAFGEVVDSLKGQYIAAEDVGTTTEDMMIIKRTTPYVCALPTDKSSGDPSRFTAWGVFRGILAVSKKIWGTHHLKRRKIAIQGLGNVGSKLANILFWEGADLILCDIDQKKVHDLSALYGAQAVDSKGYFSSDCDILSPCAFGGVLNADTIHQLNCAAIAGGANNQLLSQEDGKRLMDRGILYCPDYIINSGGISNAAAEFDEGGYNPKRVRDKVNHIYDLLWTVFRRSEEEGKPTNQIADEIAEYNLLHEIGKRKTVIDFKK